MLNEELNVKVGDKVLLYFSNPWNKVEVITEVIKVTPTGRIRVGYNRDIQFDKYGREMGNKNIWSGSVSISIPKEKDYERIQKMDAIRKAKLLMNKLNFETISCENILKLTQLLTDIQSENMQEDE